jgi:hypothetical protein
MTPITNSTSSGSTAFLVNGSHNLLPGQPQNPTTSILFSAEEFRTDVRARLGSQCGGRFIDCGVFNSLVVPQFVPLVRRSYRKTFHLISSKSPVIPHIPPKPLTECRQRTLPQGTCPNSDFTPVYRRLSEKIGFQIRTESAVLGMNHPLQRWGIYMKDLLTRLGSGAALFLAGLFSLTGAQAQNTSKNNWSVGAPIVSYWCGPALTDAVAEQMSEGGWNLVWCDEKGLDVAQRHGLRGQIQDGLLTPATLEDPKRKEALDQLIARVSKHPAFYAYFITDEPSAALFPGLGKLVAYLRERDPAHLAYINLFPTYANNEQLGTKGDTVTAYKEHLRKYVDEVKPALISYDHYQFALSGDNPDYFLNLAMVRHASLDAGVPFLNIVQASSWAPQVMRVPGPDEMRFLVYTTLAYGAQGISYYIYMCGNHIGGIANPDGSPTELYAPLKKLNHEFVAIAKELQPLKSLGVYHAGMLPPGAIAAPENSTFKFEPPLPAAEYKKPERVKGGLLGVFGKAPGEGTHALVVNLDYKTEGTFGVRARGMLEEFDPATQKWESLKSIKAELRLPGGSGKLIRVKSTP